MATVARSAVRKAGGALAAAVACLLLATEVGAQTETEAEAAARSLAICKGEESAIGDDQYDPCEQYIDVNIRNDADTVKWMLGQIEDRKAYAQDISFNYYKQDEIVQWIIVILSLLTTISAAVAKLYPKLIVRGVDFALAPIVLSSLIAAVTSINAYYQFDEYRRLSQNLAEDLEELETDIHFLVLRHAAAGSQQRVDEATINEWHDRLSTILQRYSQRETGNGV